MGCVASKPDINDQHANIFQVVNVDDLGHRYSAAKLEVTDSHLVLHQRHRAPIRWPLRCLRRYGFDAELFSFEAGRRCPTGPGIYAFKCRRAEALFNLLQLQIQNITEDTASRDALPPPPMVVRNVQDHEDTRNSELEVTPDPELCLEQVQRSRRPNTVLPPGIGATVRNASDVGIGVGGVVHGENNVAHSVGAACELGAHGPSPSPPTPNSPPPVPFYEVARTEEPPSTPSHDYSNPLPLPMEPVRQVCMNHAEKTVLYEKGRVRQASASNSYPNRSMPRSNSVLAKRPGSYMNVTANDRVYENIEPNSHNHSHDHDCVYENLGQGKDVPTVPPRPSLTMGSAGSGSSNSGTTTDTDYPPSQVNYILLDLEPHSDSSQAAPLSPFELESVASGSESGRSYAQIDFQKTDALFKTSKPEPEEELGSRKTRHNSTFTSPATLTRHNSSLSD